MNHFFVTKDGALQPRWLAAFPDAQDISKLDRAKAAAEPFTVWINRSLIADADLANAIASLNKLNGKVVVMSGVLSDEQGLEAVISGAVGYVHFLAKPSQLQEVALVVEKGGLWLGPQLLQKVITASKFISNQSLSIKADESKPSDKLSLLTDKERQVAQEVGRGASNREIAETLGVSERTVKAHLTSTFDKLMLRDRVQLALVVHDIK